VDTYSASLNRLDPHEQPLLLLQSIFSCVRTLQKRDLETQTEIELITSWTRLIDYTLVETHYSKKSHEKYPILDRTLLYNLADGNIVRYFDTPTRPMIGLASPIIYLQLLRAAGETTIEIFDLYSLSFPNGSKSQNLAAERLTMHCLAREAVKLFKLQLHDALVYELILPDGTDVSSRRPSFSESSYFDGAIDLQHAGSDSVKLRMCKEHYTTAKRDAFGADCVILDYSVDNGQIVWTAHRIQIKLGVSLITDEAGSD
jgi:hypothetical protein